MRYWCGLGGHGLPLDDLPGDHRAVRKGQLHHALGPEESHPVADDEGDETDHEQEGERQAPPVSQTKGSPPVQKPRRRVLTGSGTSSGAAGEPARPPC